MSQSSRGSWNWTWRMARYTPTSRSAGKLCVAVGLSEDQNASSCSVQDGRRFDEDTQEQVNLWWPMSSPHANSPGQWWCAVFCQHRVPHSLLDTFVVQWLHFEDMGHLYWSNDSHSLGWNCQSIGYSTTSFLWGRLWTMEYFEIMVNMTMETFSVSFWGGWAPHWLPKRFNVDFPLMLGWSLRRKVHHIPLFFCILNFGRISRVFPCFKILSTTGHRSMVWPRLWSLPQGLFVFSSADSNPWLLLTRPPLILETSMYFWQPSLTIRWQLPVFHIVWWLWLAMQVTHGEATTLVLFPALVNVDRPCGSFMMITNLHKDGMRSRHGSPTPLLMCGLCELISMWAGKSHRIHWILSLLTSELVLWKGSWQNWVEAHLHF